MTRHEVIISDDDRSLTYLMSLPSDKLLLSQGRNRVFLSGAEVDRLITAVHELRDTHAVTPAKKQARACNGSQIVPEGA